ncbi:DUF262 domain-containing protein [Paenibacillus sp. FA6]|uniref:DUF262 domain-containing protein n=1 Tax=Paenibacillus sp. FA6 TaxID=3413029 RepID=UPI003F65F11C
MAERKIDLIKTETRNVKWLVDNMRNELLKVDNSFQRQYVWLKKHQVKLIETILLGYSIPEIYLWGIDTDPDNGDTVYSIVDGQQRIGAVVDFIEGKFNLSVTSVAEKDASYANKHFSDLNSDEKKAIWDYPFSIRFIRQEFVRQDIVTMFLRLNSTNLSLNPQELRNAEFDGKFLKLAEELSNLNFWETYKIFNQQQVRRMQDIQFISNVLIFFRQGIEGDTTQTNINRVYDLYNETYEEYDDDKNLFNSILNEMEKFFKSTDEKIGEFLSKQTHLYTFMIITYYILKMHGEVKEEHVQKVSKFIDAYENTSNSNLFTTKILSDIAEYKKLSSEGTQSKSKRMRRIQIIKSVIDI